MTYLLILYVTVLGEFAWVDSLLANRLPKVNLVKKDGSISRKNFSKTAYDQIMTHGTTKDDGIVVSINVRSGRPFKGTPALDWRIAGQDGEIRMTASDLLLQDVSIEVHNFASDDVEEIDLFGDEFDSLLPMARNVARVYKTYARKDHSCLCNFEDAVERHRFLEDMQHQNVG